MSFASPAPFITYFPWMSVAPRTALGATEFSLHNAKTAKAEKFRPEQVYNVQVTSTGLWQETPRPGVCFGFQTSGRLVGRMSIWVISGQTIPGQNPPLSALVRYCCKSLFALLIKNSLGSRCDIGINMLVTSSHSDEPYSPSLLPT